MRAVGGVLAGLTATALLAGTAPANAFMTWDPPGNAEHERITRMGIACNSAFARGVNLPAGITWADLCLDSRAPGDDDIRTTQAERSLRMLAGGKGYLGGVGAPDGLAESLNSDDAAHCDNGDAWFPKSAWPLGKGVYPRTMSDRNGALGNCLNRMQEYIATAVAQAGLLVDQNNVLDPRQADLSSDCDVSYNPKVVDTAAGTQSAKCQALVAFGRALHIAEDFFSHSNWVDANPDAVGPGSPPGLATPVLSTPAVLGFPRTGAQIDAFLASSEVITGAYPTPWSWQNLPTRLYHDYDLNKDEGTGYIDWTKAQIPSGATGKTGRGARGIVDGHDNFQRAVAGATEAAASVWADYHTAILATYGSDRGQRIWRALRGTTPWTECEQYGNAGQAIAPPTGASRAARTVRVRVVNQTSAALPCNTARLDSGEWSSLPPDTVAAGGNAEFFALSNGGSADGVYQFGDVTLAFTNPVFGGNTYTCSSAKYRCSLSGGKGNDATLTVTVADAVGAAGAHSPHPDDTLTQPKGGSAVRDPGGRAQDRFQVLTPSDFNTRLPSKERRQLADEVRHVQRCDGRWANAELYVDDIACGEAGRLLLNKSRTGYMDACPPGWRHEHFPPTKLGGPDGGSTVCHQEVGDRNGRDRDARAFFYALPHAHGSARHE